MNSAPQTIRERAASSLAVAPAATAEAVRSAFLLRLASGGFVPPEECIIAVNTLADTELPLSPDGLEELNSFQRDAVEAFARFYWSLEPAKRRAHWQELTKEVSDIQAKSRLAELEGGLDHIEKGFADTLMKEIATAVREIYVLGPRDRVVQRTNWLAERCYRLDKFRDAVSRFLNYDPELAELQPELLRELSRGAAFEPVPAIDSAIAEVERSEWALRDAKKLQRKMVKQRIQAEKTREEPSSGDWTRSMLAWIILGILIGVGRLFIGLGGHTDRTTPTYRTPGLENIQIEFTPAETESFIAYERQKAAGNPPSSPPPRYALWVFKGRPGAPADSKPKGPR